MAPVARNKLDAPVFEPEVFQKQMYCIEVLVTLLGLFGAPYNQWMKVYLDMLELFFLWPCGTLQYLSYRSNSRYDGFVALSKLLELQMA